MRRSSPALLSATLGLFCLFGFAVVAAAVQAGGALVRFDEAQAEHVYRFASANPGLTRLFLWVTDLGAGDALTVVGTAAVVAILLHRRYDLALVCAAVMLLNGWSIRLLKELFGRARPPFHDLGLNPSFPSGHTQGTMVVIGLAIYLIFLRWPHARWRWVAGAALAAFILLIGLSRMVLGVHYFSDVLGGMLIGMAWLGLGIAAIEWGRSSRR